MKKAFIALLWAFLLVGCTKTLYVPVETKITVKETVRDTIIDVQLEREYVKQITPDTTSMVETKYARATAIWYGSRGLLEHSIENKKDSIPVHTQYVEREVEIEKPAPYPFYIDKPVDIPVRMPLRWYEKIFMYIGIAATGGGIIWAVVRFKR